MAITGRFVADFAAFDAAVKASVVELQGLESSGVRVEKSLNKMVDQFSGRRLIQDANLMVEAVERLGGASQLTEQELAKVSAKAAEAAEKMRVLGMEVPKGMADLAAKTKDVGTSAQTSSKFLADMGNQLASMFTFGAVVAFGKEVLEAGDKIQKMADQMSMSTDAVQEFMHIAGQSGTDVGTLTSAMQSLQENIGSGDTGVTGAIKALGINLDELKQKAPEQQMYEVAEAIRALPDPADRAAAAFAVFGNKFKEVMPAIMSGMQDLAREAPKMSQEAVAALDQLGDSWLKVKEVMVVAAAEMLKTGQDLVFKMANFFSMLKKDNQGLTDTELHKKYVDENNKLIASLGGVPPAAAAATTSVKSFAQTLADQKKATEEAANATKVAAEEADVAAKQRAAAEAEARKELEAWGAVYEEVTAYGKSYQDALAQIDGSLVAHVQSLLGAGVAAEKLAKAYGLTSSAMRAIQADLTAQITAQKQADAAIEVTAKLQEDLYQLQIQRSGTAADAQIAAVERWGEDYRRRLEQAGTDTQQAYDLIDQIVAEKTGQIGINWEHIDRVSKTSLQATADEALKTYQYMISGVEEFKVADILAMEETARAAQDAADAWGTAFEAGADRATAAAQRAGEATRAAAQEAMSWSQAMQAVAAGEGTMGGTVSGGPGTWTNYGKWGSAAHKQAVQAQYDAGRYYGPVYVTGAVPGIYDSGRSTGPNWEALGMMAQGGPVESFKPYIVGERGPEMFVPNTAGDILPNHALGGSPTIINNVFHVNGTGQDVARIVMAELTRVMRVNRKWPAV